MHTFLARLENRYMVASGLSPILYHHTDGTSAVKILKENRFRLSSAIGSVERRHSGESALYFLSTARVPYGHYQRSVIFVLDGRKLGAKYKGMPVDYWSSTPNYDESEDRILSDKPYITGAKIYIKEIHYLEIPSTTGDQRQLRLEAKKSNIPVFAYKNHHSFIHLIKKDSIPQGRLKGPSTRENPFDRVEQMRSREIFRALLSLYHFKGENLEKLSDNAIKFAKQITVYPKITLEHLDETLRSSIKSDNPQRQALMDIWRKEGLKNSADFVAFLRDKFTPRLENFNLI